FGTVSPEILAYLWMVIENEGNIIIIGGTGSGKTSFLNSIAFFIPPAARVVSIEDTKELNILHENWLPSVARPGMGATTITGERHGEVSLFDLLKESFRQRPDYVIVGEIRGQEAFVLFQGAASGHPTMSTMHAESVDTMIRRLETQPINLSPALVETLDVVCVMTETKVRNRSVRRLKEVVEIIQVKEEVGHAITNTPFVRDPAKDVFYFKTDSRVFDKISRQQGISKQDLYKEFKNRSDFLMALYRNKIFDFKEVQDMITAYYKNPKEMLRKFGIR
ncbi:MAG: type II/IV secretion system ATPase subunit, partial [Candidatus Nanoarchaeia archaeon]